MKDPIEALGALRSGRSTWGLLAAVAALGVAALGVAACGGGPGRDDPLMMTCDIRSNAGSEYAGQCQEWRGDATAETNASVDFDSVCQSLLLGTVIEGECPTEGRVGVCVVLPSVAERAVVTFYYEPDYDAGSAESDCASEGGTFSNE